MVSPQMYEIYYGDEFITRIFTTDILKDSIKSINNYNLYYKKNINIDDCIISKC